MGYFFASLFILLCGTVFAFGIIIYLAISLFIFFVYIVISIFYFLMGKQAGCDVAWMAFFPFGKNYLAFTIPHREYNLGIFKTKYRKRVFWIWFASELCVYLITGVLSLILITYSINNADYDAAQPFMPLLQEPLFIILFIASLLFGGLFLIIKSIVHWRKNYDLLITYEFHDLALPVSILNIFCPLIMIIFASIMAGRAPDYGSENYYFWEEDDISYI